MCTFVYLPSGNSFCLTSLRDESPLRPLALPPSIHRHEAGDYIAPIDPQGGGTWIGMKKNLDFIVLLNGGFDNHVRLDAYEKSRGLIVKEILEQTSMLGHWNLSSLMGMEPFTIILKESEIFVQLTWDGKNKHMENVDPQSPKIWSSSTLYDFDAKSNRRKWFDEWVCKNEVISFDSIRQFFSSIDDLQNGFIINRNERVKTISYIFIHADLLFQKLSYQYEQLLDGHRTIIEIEPQ